MLTQITTARTSWDDDFLNKMRQTGDGMADEAAIALYKDKQNRGAILGALRTLATNDTPFNEQLSPEIGNYFRKARKLPEGFEVDAAKVDLACQFFADHAFLIINILFFKSLPAGYMAPYPSKVLGTTKLMLERAARRVLETGQMIFNIHNTDWYKDDGTGIASLLKVRFMHAGMRQAMLSEENNWDRDWKMDGSDVPQGIPINQEDMALTLHVFSIIILDGLEQAGITPTEAEREAYLYNWQLAGYFMGIDKELIPMDEARTNDLNKRFRDRLYTLPNPDGPLLTRALLNVIYKNSRHIIPYWLLEDVTVYLLEPYPGAVKSLKLRQPGWFDLLVGVVLGLFIKSAIEKFAKKDENLSQTLQKKNSYLGFLFIAFAEHANVKLDTIKTNEIKKTLFQMISISIMHQLQQNAKLSDGRPFAAGFKSDVMEQWEKSGFLLDETTGANVVLGLKVTGWVLVVVSPVISCVSFWEYYNSEHGSQNNSMLLGLIKNTPGVNLKSTVFVGHFRHEMLGLGVLFLATTMLSVMSLWKNDNLEAGGVLKYARIAYLLILIAALVWLMT